MKLHSIIERITNSSSTVFIWVNDKAIEKTKEMLQKFLSMVGIKDNVDDLFEIQIKFQDDFFYERYVRCSDEWEKFVSAQGLDEEIHDKKVEDDFIAFMQEAVEIGSWKAPKDDYSSDDFKTIIVKSKKTGEIIDMYNLMFSLFGVEGGYDG